MKKTISEYKKLDKNCNLAELIGITLGDGCVSKISRTEALRITLNKKDKKYIRHVYSIVKDVFSKKPSVCYRKKENAADVKIYQNIISKRLKIPCGNKIINNIKIPRWILKTEIFIIKCLKGLFETDGHFQKSKSNYLYVIELKNKCEGILNSTYDALRKMGFHPQRGKNYVRLARKQETYRFIEVINFKNKYCRVV